MLLSLPEGDDKASAQARLTLNLLHLEPVVEAQSGGHRLVIASAKCATQAGVDIIVDVVHDYGWQLLAGVNRISTQWPRLLECLSRG